MTLAYVGVGTNVEQIKHSRAAVTELLKLDANLRVSTIYECPPVGFEGSVFYNFVIELNTVLELTEFSHYLRNIELKWGRPEDARKYQDRTLDLDIVLFGEHISSEKPEVPRSDIYKFPFVIQPLYELAPELSIPGGELTVSDVWKQMEGLDTLKAVDSKRILTDIS